MQQQAHGSRNARGVLRRVGTGLLAAAALAVLSATTQAGAVPRSGQRATAAAAGSLDWPAYLRDPGHSSAIFTDPAVTTSNAASLTRRWQFLADAATKSGQPARRFDASPTVVAGRVYIGSRTGIFYVLDATTGAVVWRKQLDFGTTVNCAPKGILGTATVAKDPVDGVLTVYVPGAHYLYALNAATGAQRWRRAVGPATAAATDTYENWSSPTVAGGRVFMGMTSKCDTNLIRGGVVSVNQHTGALQHTWYDVAAGHVGGSVWASMASDGTNVWVPTGNPDPSGTTLDDTYSIVRLAAATLIKQDAFQVRSPQGADLDFGSSPSLFTATVGGVSTQMVAACNKNGVFYALRRMSLAAGPVWSRQVGDVGGTHNGACLPSPAIDSHLGRLFVASNSTTIGGVAVAGGLRALSPATGAVLWERALPCLPNGTPTVNGQVVAVSMYSCPTGTSPSVRLFAESDGHPLGSLPASAPVFAQPVFASGKVFVAAEDGTLTAYGP